MSTLVFPTARVELFTSACLSSRSLKLLMWLPSTSRSNGVYYTTETKIPSIDWIKTYVAGLYFECSEDDLGLPAGFFNPPPFLELLVNGGAPPAAIEQALQHTFWKILAVLLAAAAVGVGISIKGCSALYGSLRSK
jgi:hypothetical protein